MRGGQSFWVERGLVVSISSFDIFSGSLQPGGSTVRFTAVDGFVGILPSSACLRVGSKASTSGGESNV
jgi:hypothetical protein